MPNISLEERGQMAPVWDMSQERIFIYTLLNQRLQFLIVFFSIVVAGAINATSQERIEIILIFGTMISWLLGITIVRTQARLTKILNILAQDPGHPFTVVTQETKQKHRIQPLISYIIPAICATSLTLGSILVLLDILTI
ncbi:hypothetical protein [Kaarinaea lacus]